MSPKVATMTPGCRANSIAVSMSAFAVTQTGQPGAGEKPDVSGHDAAQTVLRDRHGVGAADLHERDGPRDRRADRVDETGGEGRVAEAGEIHGGPTRLGGLDWEIGQLLEQLDGLVRELLVDDLDREPGVHEHVVADLSASG
jgi:hypothetical protein